MIVTTEMQDVLDELCIIEGSRISNFMHLPENELANKLIDVYYSQKSDRSGQLIREFMTKAGAVWLRKLLTKDTEPVVSSRGVFASLDEYVGLLTANDDVSLLLSNG